MDFRISFEGNKGAQQKLNPKPKPTGNFLIWPGQDSDLGNSEVRDSKQADSDNALDHLKIRVFPKTHFL